MGHFSKGSGRRCVLSANPVSKIAYVRSTQNSVFWAMNGAGVGDRDAVSEKDSLKFSQSGNTDCCTWSFCAQMHLAIRALYPSGQATHDDIADAFAALWTACRKHANLAIQIPPCPRLT